MGRLLVALVGVLEGGLVGESLGAGGTSPASLVGNILLTSAELAEGCGEVAYILNRSAAHGTMGVLVH